MGYTKQRFETNKTKQGQGFTKQELTFAREVRSLCVNIPKSNSRIARTTCQMSKKE